MLSSRMINFEDFGLETIRIMGKIYDNLFEKEALNWCYGMQNGYRGWKR